MSAEPRPARLLYDSTSSRPEWSAPDGLESERVLFFQSPGLCVDLILRQGSDGVRILRGEARAPITNRPLDRLLVRSHETGETVETDPDGRFRLGWEEDREGLRLTAEADGRAVALDVPPRSPA